MPPSFPMVFNEKKEKDDILFHMAKPIRFVVYGNDEPLLSLYVGKDEQEENSHLSEFIIYSSLDTIDEMKKATTNQYLQVVDKVNGYTISAYVTPGNAYFILLHKSTNEEKIKHFFTEIQQLYTRLILNPFFSYLSPIHNQEFNNRIRLLASKL